MMDFQDSLRKAIDILKLDEKAIANVSRDKDAFPFGLLIIAIGAILSAFSGYLLSFTSNSVLKRLGAFGSFAPSASFSSLIYAPIGAIIGTFIMTGIIHLIAMLFSGKGNFMELFRPIAFASMLSWLGIMNIVPVLGGMVNFIVGIWSIVVIVVIVKNIHSLTTGKAAAVVLLPVLIIVLVALMLGALAVAILGTGAISTLRGIF